MFYHQNKKKMVQKIFYYSKYDAYLLESIIQKYIFLQNHIQIYICNQYMPNSFAQNDISRIKMWKILSVKNWNNKTKKQS